MNEEVYMVGMVPRCFECCAIEYFESEEEAQAFK